MGDFGDDFVGLLAVIVATAIVMTALLAVVSLALAIGAIILALLAIPFVLGMAKGVREERKAEDSNPTRRDERTG